MTDSLTARIGRPSRKTFATVSPKQRRKIFSFSRHRLIPAATAAFAPTLNGATEPKANTRN